MSATKIYVPVMRTSVTGITFCVGLLITCQMDCRDMADWRLINRKQTGGDHDQTSKAKPKRAPVKKAAQKVKQPVAPVIETVAAEVIEQPVAVTEAEETRQAS
jgi:hypothetical protein